MADSPPQITGGKGGREPFLSTRVTAGRDRGSGRDIDFGGVQSSQQSAEFINLVNNVPYTLVPYTLKSECRFIGAS